MDDKSSPLDMDREALLMHAAHPPGKVAIEPTKPLTTQRDLSLAYSPGVAAPCREIARDPSLAYDYTAKGNMVAVISNGTAVLGLGNLGALASKPVMEGKAVLFKRFADVDSIDLELETEDVDEFINAVKYMGPSFGGINLEDIKAPECFIIEQRLRELMDIPVFHDDQHGTAIISAAGLINACDLTGRDLSDITLVCNGAGAAAIACVELVKAMGVKHENVILCDSKGVIYQGREAGMNQWKSAHAAPTDKRTLAEALEGADAFFGLSVKGAVTQEMAAAMAPNPIIFAMANPDPEILPEDVKAVRDDAIMATGRSDFPNQVNNVLGFPYIFRGALDVRARTINDEMKIAAARAIAELARADVPDEVGAAYADQNLKYGPDYIIPAPFDPRLIAAIPPAVAQAAMDTGVAQKPILDMDNYKTELSARLDPTVSTLQSIFDQVKAEQPRVVFAEGEEEKSIRAAITFRNLGYGQPILVGREDRIAEAVEDLGLGNLDGVEITNSKYNPNAKFYMEFLYDRLQRQGVLYRDAQRMVNQDRNTFAACMVAQGDADAMVSGLTRNHYQALDEITRVIDRRVDHEIYGMTLLLARGRTLFVADTAVHELPSATQMADMAQHCARVARRWGHEPRVAFISFSNFGNPTLPRAAVMHKAVEELASRDVDFEFDGEMGIDVALNNELREIYPFCRLSGPANVLIMPGLHVGHATTKLMRELGGATVMGPILMGLEKPAQIVTQGATVNDLVNMAALAAYQAVR
ncbi:NADP-dependent malic enzyme [Magnetospira sp. QH-2]|uniref:NADP-dependent malic enzyme n=1 Tax=Magnetospira sp. (strain QH-2) TaxID=1288970 RepID=UPI0003E815FD|nr:NADP-dependent malic enzyme [Magnetospira sp. QH-2]CCQ72257.1 NADP-dependent malic enzyme (conversion of malate into pyruvate) [Magnetospira sp. QH-2]